MKRNNRWLPLRLSVGMLACTFFAATAPGANVEVPGGLSMKVDESGVYEISSPDVGWRFAGRVRGPLKDVQTLSRNDGIGPGQETTFTFLDAEQKPLRGSICVYPGKPVA